MSTEIVMVEDLDLDGARLVNPVPAPLGPDHCDWCGGILRSDYPACQVIDTYAAEVSAQEPGSQPEYFADLHLQLHPECYEHVYRRYCEDYGLAFLTWEEGLMPYPDAEPRRRSAEERAALEAAGQLRFRALTRKSDRKTPV